MARSTDHYALRGGRSGYDRLLVLARERWPDTEALLDRAGVGPGMTGIDLGCGGGAVTIELARRVGPSGRMVGLDRDGSVLELARQAAEGSGVRNIAFREGSMGEWREASTYDLVYSRFLLHHLSDPAAVVRTMWRSVRPGGVLVLEDADHDGWVVDPPNAGFEFYRTSLAEVIRRSGGDPTFGRKLFRTCLEAGAPDPQVHLTGSVWVHSERKQLAGLTLDSISDAIVEQGIADRGQVADARRRLEESTSGKTTIICGPRIFQVFARKPGKTEDS